jgi:K+-transporting ATPase KdpF subunit
MKTKTATFLFSLPAAPLNAHPVVSNGMLSYLVGGIIALLILGYLIYTLLHPEKF